MLEPIALVTHAKPFLHVVCVAAMTTTQTSIRQTFDRQSAQTTFQQWTVTFFAYRCPCDFQACRTFGDEFNITICIGRYANVLQYLRTW